MEHILQALRGKGYATDGAQFPISRPDRATVPLVTRTGMPVVGKLYPSGQGERIYANMQELWHSSFGEGRRPPGLPRPLDYLPDIGVLILERSRAAGGVSAREPDPTGQAAGRSTAGAGAQAKSGKYSGTRSSVH